MNKRIRILIALVLLNLQLLPAPLIYAETVVENVPRAESTIPSKADDPLKSIIDDVSRSDLPSNETTEESAVDNQADKLEAEKKTASDENTVQIQSGIQPFGGGIGPQTVNLVEGVDIDAQFAQVLRTDASAQNLGSSWSGYGKAQDQLTDDDMALLGWISVEYRSLTSLHGISYAVNLQALYCSGNTIASLDISQNPKLIHLTYSSNPSAVFNISANLNLETLIVTGNQWTTLDTSIFPKLKELDCSSGKLTTINVSQNDKLEILTCSSNQLSTLDTLTNPGLKSLTCENNSITALDVTQNVELEHLSCRSNPLSALDITNNDKLITLNCESTQLVSLNTSSNLSLTQLRCSRTPLASLDLSLNSELLVLECYMTQLTSLDISNNKKLWHLRCENNNNLTSLITNGADALQVLECYSCKLADLDLRGNLKLKNLRCYRNELTSLRIEGLAQLDSVSCYNNKLTTLDTSQNSNLNTLHCGSNLLTQLDVSQNGKLRTLSCGHNKLSSLVVAGADNLTSLSCESNRLESLDVSQNLKLQSLECMNNQISDITSAYGLNQLYNMDARGQSLSYPLPPVTNNKAMIAGLLKTSASIGLNASNGDILGTPSFNPIGDDIELIDVTKDNMSGRYINFEYTGTDLSEGAIGATKAFSGTISFYSVSDLVGEIKPDKKKIHTNNRVEWTWEITNEGPLHATDIHADILSTMPSGLTLDTSSIKIDNSIASVNDINGTNNLGGLPPWQNITVTFETIATGPAEEWLEVEGNISWKDYYGTYNSQAKNAVQILDDEQSYSDERWKSMEITSVPLYLNYGIKSRSNTAKVYHLDATNYQTNTNVVTKGFYTRLRDDSSTSTGWKLTAKLSNFSNVSGVMPYNGGTALKMENLSVERITDRDTPQETNDPAPSGPDVPTVNNTNVSLEVGQSATTLLTAQPNQGMDTWQLRMPFDKISLNLPANAGKRGQFYKAKLTWSLDNTP